MRKCIIIYDLHVTALNAESAEQLALLQTLSQKERGWPRETITWTLALSGEGLGIP